MDKIKLLTLSVFTLLLLNLGLVTFLLLGNSHGIGRENHLPKPSVYISNQLHFDHKQQQEYQALIRVHRNRIQAIDYKIRKNKNELYNELTQPTINSKIKDSLIAILTNCQKEIETTHFNHFQDIKKLCREGQLNEFNELTASFSKIFSKAPRPQND